MKHEHDSQALNARWLPGSGITLLSAFILAGAVAGCLPASRGVQKGRGTGNDHQALEQAYAAPTIGHDRRSILQAAESWLGVPYAYGGASRSGTDCSGFVRSVYGTIDRSLPRTSAEQASVGESVALAAAAPGDLVFFSTTGGGVSHVGILLNSDQFVHASTSVGVTVSSLSETYYRSRFLFARRVLP